MALPISAIRTVSDWGQFLSWVDFGLGRVGYGSIQQVKDLKKYIFIIKHKIFSYKMGPIYQF